MLIKEVEQRNTSIEPLTPQQARIKSLQTQKDNANKALKAERERQKVIKAQQVLQKTLD